MFVKIAKIDLSDIDTNTGNINNKNGWDSDKFNKQKILWDIKTDANRHRSKVYNPWEAVKDGTIGTAVGFAAGNALNWSARAKGVAGLLAGGLLTAQSLRKQKGEYNRQMAARELLMGENTDRSKVYLNELTNKYYNKH